MIRRISKLTNLVLVILMLALISACGGELSSPKHAPGHAPLSAGGSSTGGTADKSSGSSGEPGKSAAPSSGSGVPTTGGDSGLTGSSDAPRFATSEQPTAPPALDLGPAAAPDVAAKPGANPPGDPSTINTPLLDTAPAPREGAAGGPAPSVDGSSSGSAAGSSSTAPETNPATGGDLYGSGRPAQPQYQSPLLAGQVDDNAKFAEYIDYIHGFQGPTVYRIAVDQRLFVRVVDGQQHPVAGARVQLYDGQRQVFDGRTVSDGRVLFFPEDADATQTRQFRAGISRGQAKLDTTLYFDGGEKVITLSQVKDNTGPVNLDLAFLLDSTGSMDDEIAKIKATVDSIASRIEQMPGSARPRFGLVTYRDRGDVYITRSWDFTGDIQQFSANLAHVEANDGGDYPESVNAGLHDAIHLPGWADASAGRHLRMIVLVGDAPPHLDYANDYLYPQLLQEAVAAGIKIFPIGASGLDDQGEYIFRQFAEVTQGQFVFLTYANGVSGEPGVSTDHHVSDFTVQNLDSLVVRLVAGEIGNQTGTVPQGGEQPIGVGTTIYPPAQPPAPFIDVTNPPELPAPAPTYHESRFSHELGKFLQRLFIIALSVTTALAIVVLVAVVKWTRPVQKS